MNDKAKNFLELHGECLEEMLALKGELTRLRSEHAELLAACQAALAWNRDRLNDGYSYSLDCDLEAAIARATATPTERSQGDES